MSSGNNRYGQLGLGDYAPRNLFCEIKGIGKNTVEVKSGYLHTIIRLTNGTLMSCGCNESGQLGLGDNLNRFSYEEIRGIPKNIDEVVSGSFHSVVALTDKTLMSCGFNSYGQLGLGDNIPRNIFSVIKI
ncbi:MAG: chromosome condensation regulator [Hyperionvirus sp.]|uniref:Chromosome condensation regulator n=1 Tax=Hyperionvirus sp. TaxID=2487770 RepID=A0A3G5A9B5_9VIRU|nr:MAG: chromosome condensation regulator [Hyperionvirus sp.]